MTETDGEAAHLRLVFQRAAEEYAAILAGRSGTLSRNWKPSKEDEQIMAVWAKLYEAVRDTTAGLGMLQVIQEMRDHADRLEREIHRLNALLAGAASGGVTMTTKKKNPPLDVGQIWREVDGAPSQRRKRYVKILNPDRDGTTPWWVYCTKAGVPEPHGYEPANGFTYDDWWEHCCDVFDFYVYSRFEFVRGPEEDPPKKARKPGRRITR